MCLAAPTVTGKGHRKIEPKAKHFSDCKKDQSSRPNQTDNSKRVANISNYEYKNFKGDSNNIHREADHKSKIHRISANTPQKSITSNRSPRTSRRTSY